MAEAVKCGLLTEFRLNEQNLRQGCVECIRQLHVFAATIAAAVPTVPAVAKRIPPHKDRSIQRIGCEQLCKKREHRVDARGARSQWQVRVKNNSFSLTIKIRDLN